MEGSRKSLFASELFWIFVGLSIAYLGLFVYYAKVNQNQPEEETVLVSCEKEIMKELDVYKPSNNANDLIKQLYIDQVTLSPGLDEIPCNVHGYGEDLSRDFFMHWRDSSRPQCQLTEWDDAHAIRYLELTDMKLAKFYNKITDKEDRAMFFGLVLTYHDGGVFVGDGKTIPNNGLNSWVKEKGKFTLAVLFDSVCDALNDKANGSHDLVFVAAPGHPVIRDSILRIKQKYNPGRADHESPYTSFYKVIANTISADSSLCQRKSEIKMVKDILLLPSDNSFWKS